MANGKDAADIALHFVNLTDGRATKAAMGRTVNMAKSILDSGYSKEEIIEVIDYIINVKHIEMYSLGFVNATINKMLREIGQIKSDQAKADLKATVKAMTETETAEVIANEHRTNNHDKLSRIGIQSWEREKSFSDLFAEL